MLTGAWLSRAWRTADSGARFQFEREGYFCLDSEDSTTGQLVFNRIVSLRDSWGKSESA